ncbi:MAG TPA: hypothetical protein DEP19_01645 [Anaerolineae bacterium]|nr:hypothetical protein [Anaerolineae bacterium]HCK65462.1 hypothetical protein [Anaerolineae bacterium]
MEASGALIESVYIHKSNYAQHSRIFQLMIGKILNHRYKIISLLGESRMGDEYLANEEQTVNPTIATL